MEPYRDQEITTDKGLFTFYRQQAEFQENAKNKKYHQMKINELLEKAIDSKQKQNTIKKRPIKQKRLKQLQKIPQQTHSKLSNRQTYELKKANINQKSQNNPSNTQQFQIGNFTLQQIQQKIILVSSPKLLQDQKDQFSFLRYQSDLQSIKSKKKKIIFVQKQSLTQRTNAKTNIQKYKEHIKSEILNKKMQELKSQDSTSFCHFKKLSLQPTSFQGFNDDLNSKQFIPVSIKKDRKNILKSYTKRKQCITNKVQASNSPNDKHNRQLLQHNSPLKSPSLKQKKQNQLNQNYSKEINNKLIRVEKLQNKISTKELNQNKNSSVQLNRAQGSFLPRVKGPLPGRYASPNERLDKSSGISLQMFRKFTQKNKNKMHNLSKKYQSQFNSINLNDNVAKDQLQMIKYVGNNYALEFRKKSQESEPIQKSLQLKNISVEERNYSKKQKMIFMKKQEFIKNYNKLVKGNVFGVGRENKTRVQQKLAQKKQQIINNLLSSLTYL